MKKLRDMKMNVREDEIFHYIEKAILSAKGKEISAYNERYQLPDDTTVVILDRWKGKLAKEIAKVV